MVPQNSRHQKGDMNQVPYWRLAAVRRFHCRCGRHGDLAPGVCAPLLCSLYWPVNNLSPDCAVTSLIALFEVDWLVCKLDVRESVHRDTAMKITNEMLYIYIYINLLFQVSSTCFGRRFRPSSGALDCIYSICSVHPSCCRLAAGSNLGEHYQIL